MKISCGVTDEPVYSSSLSKPCCLRKYLRHIERAMLRTVLLILSLKFVEAKKKFKSSPKSCLVPRGSLFLLQRL